MKKISERLFTLKLPNGKSAFLWGPRKAGKSYWVNHHLKNFILIDLLKTDIFAEYITKPNLLRERYSEESRLIIIDEIQKVPALLDEIHWLIENKNCQFLLTGSSARKLKRNNANLLGGRAWRYHMMPLCTPELEDYDIEEIIVSGLLPPHFLSTDPIQDLRAYVADYLKEEIIAEALVQNIPSFSEFLTVLAHTNGELLNYSNVARESGTSTKNVRAYFQILEDTLLGYRLQPWRKQKNRRLIETEKFYLFDIGLANYLRKQKPKLGSTEFGKAFEHFIFMELKAYQAYKNPELSLYYWRTASNLEVDFILGEMDVALEIKSSKRVSEYDTKNLAYLSEEYNPKKAIIIGFETEKKQFKNGIIYMHWKTFLNQLWNKNIV